MNRKYSPEIVSRALRMLAETRPSHPTMMSAVRHVAGLLGMSPETLRLWQRRAEVDAGVKPGLTTDAAVEIKRLHVHEEKSRVTPREHEEGVASDYERELSGEKGGCRSITKLWSPTPGGWEYGGFVPLQGTLKPELAKADTDVVESRLHRIMVREVTDVTSSRPADVQTALNQVSTGMLAIVSGRYFLEDAAIDERLARGIEQTLRWEERQLEPVQCGPPLDPFGF